MANTTFSGPVRSQNGFETISINSTTGAVTTTATIGPAMSVTSVTASGAIAGASVSATGNLTADSGTAPASGGMSAIQISSTANFGIFVGAGVPTVTAAQGSLYLRTDGTGVADRLYVRGAAGWIAISTAS